MTEPDPLLQRAASFLRTTPEPGWEAISARVLAAVHAAPRPGWPLRAHMPPGANGNIFVSDNALRALLARELRRRFLCQPTAINFTLEGTALRAVDINVTGSYGTQLRELGDAIRDAVATIIKEVLDAAPDQVAGQPVDVTITDVVTGDPLTS